MPGTAAATETRVDEIAEGVYRLSTASPAVPGGFTFNQFLIADEQPLLFHTGPRKMFPSIREALGRVIPVERLRYVAFSHVEADECGSLNEFLAVAPGAEPLCGGVAKLVSVDDLADRPARGLRDGEEVCLGRHTVRWIDAPHLPHGWECGYLHERSSGTLLCGDLFTQPGADPEPVTERDILGPSEAMREKMDYFSHTKHARALLGKLAALKPGTLACMHGSSWKGDGAGLLGALAEALG